MTPKPFNNVTFCEKLEYCLVVVHKQQSNPKTDIGREGGKRNIKNRTSNKCKSKR